MTDDPHAGAPLERAGASLADASVAMLLVHGRGASATGILGLATEIDRDDVAYLAPQADGNTWYPQSFLAPRASNQPHLDSALARIDDVLETVVDAGVEAERTVLLGFSQGACLASECAASSPRRYGGVVALSGGLIGSTVDHDRYQGSLDGTPAFFGCSDVDPHIPVERVHDSVHVYESLEADVTERIYEGMGHTINDDELTYIRELVDDLAD